MNTHPRAGEMYLDMHSNSVSCMAFKYFHYTIAANVGGYVVLLREPAHRRHGHWAFVSRLVISTSTILRF